MKKILLILAVAMVMASCKKYEEKLVEGVIIASSKPYISDDQYILIDTLGYDKNPDIETKVLKSLQLKVADTVFVSITGKTVNRVYKK